MPGLHSPTVQQDYWKCVIQFLLNGRVIAGRTKLHLIDIWSWHPGRSRGEREPGVCALPNTIWGSGYIHSAFRGEMTFKVTLVPVLKTTRIAAMLLISVQRCTPKNPPVQRVLRLVGTDSYVEQVCSVPCRGDSALTPAQRETDA